MRRQRGESGRTPVGRARATRPGPVVGPVVQWLLIPRDPAEPPASADPSARAAVPPQPAGPDARDGLLDAAKYAGMCLVVVGHAIEPLTDGRPVRALYLLIYAFHMPLFVLLCGHVSRDLAVTPRRAERLLTGVALPYLIFETAYSALAAVLDDRPFAVTPLDPYWLMWFLVALGLWRAALPYLARLRWPLAAAVAVSLLAGLTAQTGPTVVFRTLGLLPFFVLGHLLPPGFHRRLRTAAVRAAGAAAFAAAAAGAWLLAPAREVSWVYWRGETPFAARVALLLTGLVLSGAFLAWVPVTPALAALGRRSLYVFLLHGFVLLVVRHLGWYDAVSSWVGVLAVVGSALLLATLLATAPVRRVFRPVVEPRAAWLLWRPSQRSTGEPGARTMAG